MTVVLSDDCFREHVVWACYAKASDPNNDKQSDPDSDMAYVTLNSLVFTNIHEDVPTNLTQEYEST